MDPVAITNIVLTAGLLFFAGMQWWVTAEAERARIAERQADRESEDRRRDDELHTAFQTVWAEHFRLDSLAGYWEHQDLLSLSALGVLRPGDLLPRDWPTLVHALNRLGRESGFLGGVAITLAHDIEREVASLNALVESFSRKNPALSPAQISEVVRKVRGPEAAGLERRVIAMTQDLAKLMWDAARQSPRADVDRLLDFSDDMESQFGRSAVKDLLERQKDSKILPEAG